jgi:hypothetical protein
LLLYAIKGLCLALCSVKIHGAVTLCPLIFSQKSAVVTYINSREQKTERNISFIYAIVG